MAWLYSIDIAGFRWVNLSLRNPLFDWLMPFLSGNPYFFPLIALVAAVLIWKGGTRGRVFLCLITLIVLLGDAFLFNTIKQAVGRLRPLHQIADAQVLVGNGHGESFPSSHAANWFAAAMVAYLFYRRSRWFMLPLAAAVSFSRVYNGVHYPSDVLAGAILGAGYALAGVWLINTLWQRLGHSWFPLWWIKLPSLVAFPETGMVSPVLVAEDPANADSLQKQAKGADACLFARSSANGPRPLTIDQHWLRLGYLIIVVVLLARWAYLASGQIELSEDEAYQWIWSKHPALSYYSKPPLIAYTQRLGTTLWGDNEFGVRFFAPVIAAILSFMLMRFLAQQGHVRAGFWVVLMAMATPLLAVGSILMTVDPLSVLFWTAAMITGWRAVQHGCRRLWLWTGLWMGLGFLSKYTALFQLLCWAVFFLLWKPARAQLRRAGPYLALGINAFCSLPVLIWNYQNDWITITHVASDAGLHQAWRPTLRFFWDFLGAEAGLLNPVFFVATLWAAAVFWRRRCQDPLMFYLFSMGAPLFLFFWLYSLHSRVLPNWIAPSVVPLFCLTAVYWESRWRTGCYQVKYWLIVGLALGLTTVIVLHDTDLLGKTPVGMLPAKLDPLRRVRAWSNTAQAVGEARRTLLSEGKPVFIIGDHYGITSQVTFYLPEAKAAMLTQPLVYYLSSVTPKNQFYFWPGYQDRRGQNAIYVHQTGHEVPQCLRQEFVSVQDLGTREILYRGRVFHRLRLYVCRELRGIGAQK